MVVANDDTLADRMRRVKGQGQSATRRYWHVELGFNYRMTNICAAIGLAQMERIDQLLARKQAIASIYRSCLSDLPVKFQELQEGVDSSNWLVSLLLPKGVDRDKVMNSMRDRSVDSRPVFYCAHHMPMYQQEDCFTNAEDVAARGISLPSYPALSDGDVRRVADTVRQALNGG
jgi:perosamine synthetase